MKIPTAERSIVKKRLKRSYLNACRSNDSLFLTKFTDSSLLLIRQNGTKKLQCHRLLRRIKYHLPLFPSSGPCGRRSRTTQFITLSEGEYKKSPNVEGFWHLNRVSATGQDIADSHELFTTTWPSWSAKKSNKKIVHDADFLTVIMNSHLR